MSERVKQIITLVATFAGVLGPSLGSFSPGSSTTGEISGQFFQDVFIIPADYTFAIWDGDALVPFAKAYSGLTDAEIRKVDAFIRRNTVEKFGPVRTVKPELVFELAFEGIQRSTRHKSGIAVRFPRIARWRIDKPASEADTLSTVKALLASEGASD